MVGICKCAAFLFCCVHNGAENSRIKEAITQKDKVEWVATREKVKELCASVYVYTKCAT